MTENNKKSSSKKFSIRKLIYNDKYLIIFSILAAIAIWIGTSINLSPQTTKTITVPVNVDFSNSAASQLGIKCYGEASIDVDVTVSCKKYLAKDITSDDLIATLQTNVVTNKGVIDVPIKVESGDRAEFTIQSYYPTHYSAYFDVEAEKNLDIELRYNNKDFIAEGYIMGSELLSETSAKITGPKTYVSLVDKLVADVNIDEKLTKTQSIDIKPQPIDVNGNIVDYITVDSGNVNLTLPVLKQMELGVAVSFTSVPEGFDSKQLAVVYSVRKVNAGVLEDAGITEATIGNIDFSELKSGINRFTFQVSTLESMVILDDISEINVSVTVPSSVYTTKSVGVSASDVTVAKVPEGYKAEVVSISSKNVSVVGKADDLKSTDLGVGMVVDLSSQKEELQAGTYDLPVTATVENSKNCWVYGNYTARISITKE